jgi:hypothetical protein
MAYDPGLLTDSTGDGSSGSTDVSLETQQKMKETYYNGSTPCVECGLMLNPAEALYAAEGRCATCNRRKQSNVLKGRMA